MTRTIEAYELYCDGCGDPVLNEYGGVEFCRDVENVTLIAESADWLNIEGRYYCDDCRGDEGATQVARIPLYGSHGEGKLLIIDAEDFERVSKYRWRTNPRGKSSDVMPLRSLRSDGHVGYVYLHHFIMGTKPGSGIEIDHINRNRLDNRKCNLRRATHSQNNTNKIYVNRNGFRGVVKHRDKFRAQIEANGRAHSKGGFATAEDAAHYYDKKALELYGEFAILNFPKVESANGQ